MAMRETLPLPDGMHGGCERGGLASVGGAGGWRFAPVQS